jgi:hypothetical protein
MKSLMLACYFFIGFTTGTLYNAAIESAYERGKVSMLASMPIEALVHVEVEEI